MPNSIFFVKFTLICAFIFSLTSCTKEESGTLLGAVGGALVGSAVSNGSGNGVVIGALAGGIIGNRIGNQLDEDDRKKMYETTQSALETGVSGTTSQWHNPDNGHAGTVTPQPSYENTDGQYCREYQQTVTIGGEPETAYGTACRQPDGTWKIVNS